MTPTWFHGSPLALTVLRKGSTITRDRRLAEVFSHKPAIVSVDGEGEIKHDGTLPGLLYRIVGHVAPGDIRPHPNSSMAPGKEWLTTRDFALELIGPVEIVQGERLAEEELAALMTLIQGQGAG